MEKYISYLILFAGPIGIQKKMRQEEKHPKSLGIGKTSLRNWKWSSNVWTVDLWPIWNIDDFQLLGSYVCLPASVTCKICFQRIYMNLGNLLQIQKKIQKAWMFRPFWGSDSLKKMTRSRQVPQLPSCWSRFTLQNRMTCCHWRGSTWHVNIPHDFSWVFFVVGFSLGSSFCSVFLGLHQRCVYKHKHIYMILTEIIHFPSKFLQLLVYWFLQMEMAKRPRHAPK